MKYFKNTKSIITKITLSVTIQQDFNEKFHMNIKERNSEKVSGII